MDQSPNDSAMPPESPQGFTDPFEPTLPTPPAMDPTKPTNGFNTVPLNESPKAAEPNKAEPTPNSPTPEANAPSQMLLDKQAQSDYALAVKRMEDRELTLEDRLQRARYAQASGAHIMPENLPVPFLKDFIKGMVEGMKIYREMVGPAQEHFQRQAYLTAGRGLNSVAGLSKDLATRNPVAGQLQNYLGKSSKEGTFLNPREPAKYVRNMGFAQINPDSIDQELLRKNYINSSAEISKKIESKSIALKPEVAAELRMERVTALHVAQLQSQAMRGLTKGPGLDNLANSGGFHYDTDRGFLLCASIDTANGKITPFWRHISAEGSGGFVSLSEREMEQFKQVTEGTLGKEVIKSMVANSKTPIFSKEDFKMLRVEEQSSFMSRFDKDLGTFKTVSDLLRDSFLEQERQSQASKADSKSMGSRSR